MIDFKNINKYVSEIESPFEGLPHAIALLVKILVLDAEPKTGLVKNISYSQLAKKLYIKPAPGRANSGIPTKQTIRNYVNVLERDFPKYFINVSHGQKLQFKFPDVPNIYIKYFGNESINQEIQIEGVIGNKINIFNATTKVNTEANLDKIFENTKPSSLNEDKDHIELNTEVNTSSTPVKNIIFNNINNNNNNKQSISNHFTPNAETISRAKALGYSNVEDPEEIQNFISYNKACGAQWADFNPIYLRWLAKSQERQQQTPQMKNTRSFNHENQHRNNTKTNPSSVRERVIQAYASEFTFCEETRRFDSKAEQEQRIYCDFVAAIN